MTVAARPRLDGLDRLRGFAVALMFVDHLALVFGPAGGVGFVLGRLTVTRASLPMFCLVAGALLPARRARLGRLIRLGLVGAAAAAISTPLGFGQPDIVLLLAAGVLLGPAIRRWPIPTIVLGLVQVEAWPMSLLIPWAGYQPGVVLGLMAAGALINVEQLDRSGMRLPHGFAWFGRHALPLYLAHLVAIFGAALALTVW